MQIKVFVLAKGTHLQYESDIVADYRFQHILHLNSHFPAPASQQPCCFCLDTCVGFVWSGLSYLLLPQLHFLGTKSGDPMISTPPIHSGFLFFLIIYLILDDVYKVDQGGKDLGLGKSVIIFF